MSATAVSQTAGLGAPPDTDGRPDAGGVKVALSITPATDAGGGSVLSLGEGGLGRGRVRCRKIADDGLAAQVAEGV